MSAGASGSESRSYMCRSDPEASANTFAANHRRSVSAKAFSSHEISSSDDRRSATTTPDLLENLAGDDLRP